MILVIQKRKRSGESWRRKVAVWTSRRWWRTTSWLGNYSKCYKRYVGRRMVSHLHRGRKIWRGNEDIQGSISRKWFSKKSGIEREMKKVGRHTKICEIRQRMRWQRLNGKLMKNCVRQVRDCDGRIHSRFRRLRIEMEMCLHMRRVWEHDNFWSYRWRKWESERR